VVKDRDERCQVRRLGPGGAGAMRPCGAPAVGRAGDCAMCAQHLAAFSGRRCA